ncbi:hypothetical protein [Moumouvirus maliensis]|nr:hypothetical protein [Moumouvirus maliensis]
MDFKNELYNRLLSEDNVNYLVGIILSKYRISEKAAPKCHKMIYNNFLTYLNNINRYPQNNDELLQAINFLNQKCHDDFITYLSNKYPKLNLSRTPTVTDPITEKYPVTQSNEQTYYDTPESNITIITQDEYDNLVKKNKPDVSKSDDFFSYLTNPLVLQMFSMITNQNIKHDIKPDTKPDLVFDEILDYEQVQKLLPNKNNNTQQKEIKEHITNIVEQPIKKETSDLKIENSQNDSSIEKNDDIDIEKIQNLDPLNLTTEDLLFLNNEAKKLIALKNKFMKEGNHDMIIQIDKKNSIIRDKITKHRQKLDSDVKNTKNKLSTITKSLDSGNNTNNMDELNLEIDPTIEIDEIKNNNYSDLKDIKIELKKEKKITEITLVNYYLPSNKKNITRFNNKFSIYFNNGIARIVIQPGFYTLDTLFECITSQVSYLKFSVDKNNIITISNTYDMEFDLVCDKIEETILPILGFRDKIDKYKQNTSYTGSTSYNLDMDKIYFSLSGTAMEPFEVEPDKEMTPNKIIKKSRTGLTLKYLILNFKNSLDQYYDFNDKFKICLKITYANN